MKTLIIIVLLLPVSFAKAQSADVVYEFPDSAHAQIYFNEQYNLVDKNCEFQSIRRVIKLDNNRMLFNGEFSDYDKDGNTILTGTYRETKKEGSFKAFYPNGYLKWETTYTNDQPSGTWFYYYPSGKPKAIMSYRDSQLLLNEYWDDKGKLIVTKGNGKFELADQAFGFNERGFYALLYKGKIKNGLPDEIWTITELYKKSPPAIIVNEAFKNGKLVLGYNAVEYKRYSGGTTIQFAETEYFLRAEKPKMISCRVDDHLNFSDYLGKLITRRFKSFQVQPVKPFKLELTIKVDAVGRGSNVRLKTAVDKDFEKVITGALQSVNYWIPSQKDGKIIPDSFTISTYVQTDEAGIFVFSLPEITREKGT